MNKTSNGKFHFLNVILMAGVLLLIGGCSTHDHYHDYEHSATGQTDSSSPWSVVGTWDCHHPAWHHTITISPDGTFSFGQKVAGHWTLADLEGHVTLVLAWRRWPVETATMISTNELRGKVRGGELVMRRIQP